MPDYTAYHLTVSALGIWYFYLPVFGLNITKNIRHNGRASQHLERNYRAESRSLGMNPGLPEHEESLTIREQDSL
jgi:hypothetical protein